MDVGVAVFAGSYGLAPPALGRAVEARGFESLFCAEHTHIPVASRRPDGRPVRPFAETYDPFVALSAVAAVTTTLKVGTGVCLVTERDPIITAKAVASLDRIAEGASCSAWGPDGTVRNCSTTAPIHGPGWDCSLIGSTPCVASGPKMRPSTTAASLTSIRSGRGPSPSSDRTLRCWWAATAPVPRIGS